MYSSNKLFKARRQPVITRLLSFQSVMLRIIIIIRAWKANKIGRCLNKATQVLSLSLSLYFWLSPRSNRIFLTLGGFSHNKKHEYLDREYLSNKLFKTRPQPIIARLLSFQSVMLRINRAWKHRSLVYTQHSQQDKALSK